MTSAGRIAAADDEACPDEPAREGGILSADHQKRPKRVRAVERIEDWADARYSHVPPRAAIDTRLTLAHFRILVLIGKVNTQHGWCQLSQSATAGLFDMHRKTVNTAVTDLVSWGYVQKRNQAETKTSFCHYRVLIDAIDADETEAGTGEGGVPPTGYTPGGRGVPSTDGTGVTSGSYTGAVREVTPPLSKIDHRSEITPPTPQGASAGEEGNSNSGWARKWDDEARAAVAHVRSGVGSAHVATRFVDGVRGILNPPADVDGAAYVRQLAAKLRDHDGADLARTADILLGLVPSLAGHEDAARKRDLPSAVDVGRLAEAVRAERLRSEAAAAPGAAVPVAGADPEVVARTAAVMAGLKAMIGTAAFHAWFRDCHCVGLDGEKLLLAAPNKFFAQHIERTFRDHLIRAASAVLPGVRMVDVVEATKLGRAA